MYKFYTYFRSSAAFRVRIALNLKGLSVAHVPIHLLRDGGRQFDPDYVALNPEALVPMLIDEAGRTFTQSLAIIEYLDEVHPTPSLLPGTPEDRAWTRSVALAIACDIHPLNNLRVLKYLRGTLGVSETEKDDWYRHWVRLGFAALEKRLARDPRVGRFVCGDTPSLGDICLVPQVFNAQRFQIGLEDSPTIARIHANCMKVDAFTKAVPAAQPDAE